MIVAISCYNEAPTIGKVVRDFRRVLPQASIHVFDNNSTDGSADIAGEAGAVVHVVRDQGKGHVVRVVLNTMESDQIIMVDGDDTYVAEDAPRLLEPIERGEADMVIGNRLPQATGGSLQPVRYIGNRLIVWLVNTLFGTNYQDVLSGYRAINRRFAETVPISARGFEVEVEMTLQALKHGLTIVEAPISYRNRPPDSASKLHPIRDGMRIIMKALRVRFLH